MVLVVEVVEPLRQLEGIFGGVRRLGGGDTLLHHGGKLPGTEPEFP